MSDLHFTLKHQVFFEELASREESDPAWQPISAGLIVLRLVDRWIEEGCVRLPSFPERPNIRAAVEQLDPSSPARWPMLGIFDTVVAAESVADLSGVASRVLAYGDALESQGQWRIARDVYATVLEYAAVDDTIDGLLRAANGLRICDRKLEAAKRV